MNIICKFKIFDNMIESLIHLNINYVYGLCKGHETGLRMMSSRWHII
jgi:hypothetical protein